MNNPLPSLGGSLLKKQTIYQDDSWSVDLSDDCLVINTLDYHASSLNLPLEKLTQLPSTPERTQSMEHRRGYQQSADYVKVGRQNKWTITISQTAQSLMLVNDDAQVEPLRLSRKELYSIAKLMRRRVKKSRAQ